MSEPELTVRTTSAEHARMVAEAIGRVLVAGDVVLLVGDIGSGKTTFAQGLARGLDVVEPVTSPTFTIVHEYRGRVPVAHIDVYRLDHVQELLDIGFEDLLEGDVVAMIEWGNVALQVLGPEYLAVSLEAGLEPDERVVQVTWRGRRWEQRGSVMRSALEGPV